jgi:hypothetical protein
MIETGGADTALSGAIGHVSWASCSVNEDATRRLFQVALHQVRADIHDEHRGVFLPCFFLTRLIWGRQL